MIFSASRFDAESRDQPRRGRESTEDHGRKSADSEVTQAQQGDSAVHVTRGTEKVRGRDDLKGFVGWAESVPRKFVLRAIFNNHFVRESKLMEEGRGGGEVR